MIRRRLGTRLRLMVIVVASLWAVQAASAEPEPAPAFWKIEKGEATVHLFGTIHLMTPRVPWFTPRLRAVFAAADYLVIEVAPDQLTPEITQPLMAKYGLYPPGQTLGGNIPPALYANVMAAARKIGMQEQALAQMRPWLAGVVLSLQIAAANGYLPQYGVDQALRSQASATGKQVLGLESVEAQLSLFAAISPPAQVKLLEISMEQLEDIEGLFATLKEAWLTGDLETLKGPLIDSMAEVPEAVDALLVRRNRAWVPQIVEMLDGRGSYFVAIGATHVIGDTSLIKMLEAEGLEVERQ